MAERDAERRLASAGRTAERDLAAGERRAEKDLAAGERRVEKDLSAAERRAQKDFGAAERGVEKGFSTAEKDVEKGFSSTEKFFKGEMHTEYERFFMKHRNKKFAEDAEVALRAAVFVLILALPFLLPRDDVRKWSPETIDFMDKGWYSKYVIACFLFSYYKDLPNTVNGAATTVFGVFLAVLGIWILFGVYPDGIQPESPTWLYYVCFAYGAVYTWIILWLNLPLNTIIFALASWVWYYMAFMNPNVGQKNFAKGFTIDLTGAATKELLNATAGALLAVIAMCIPRPLLASKKALDDSSTVVKTVLGAWKDLSRFACARTQEEMNAFEEATIKRDLREIFVTIGGISGNLDVSWWECLGLGRIQKQRVMLYSLESLLSESYDRILSVFGIALADRSPSELTRKMEEPIDMVITNAGYVLAEGLAAITEAKVTGDREGRLRSGIETTRESVRNLTRAFRAEKQRLSNVNLDPKLFAEHAFCLTICAFGSGVADWAEDKLVRGNISAGSEGGFLGLGSLKGIFDENELFNSAEHLSWTIRNWLSLCISFYIGYVGSFSWEGPDGSKRSFQLTQAYNAAITGTMAVLMSKSISTGIAKNLGRLQGVILGTAVGVKLYAIFATDCSWAGMGCLSIAIFCWMLFTFFLYHNSDVNCYLAFLLGYCGTMNMIAGCGQLSGLAIGNTVMDLLMTIVIISVMDMLFAKDTAAHMATKELHQAWKDIRKSINDVLDPDERRIEFKPGKIMGQIGLATTLGTMAAAEARWHRTPWRGATFDSAVASATRIRYILTGMKCAVAGGSRDTDKPETMLTLTRLPTWKHVQERPHKKIKEIEDLLVILKHEKEGVDKDYKKAEQDVRAHFHLQLPELVDELVKFANQDPFLRSQQPPDTLEQDPAARQSYLLGAIAAILDEARSLESTIIYDG